MVGCRTLLTGSAPSSDAPRSVCVSVGKRTAAAATAAQLGRAGESGGKGAHPFPRFNPSTQRKKDGGDASACVVRLTSPFGWLFEVVPREFLA